MGLRRPSFIFQLQSIIWKYKPTFSWILKFLCHQGQWADAFRNESQTLKELCWHPYPPPDGGRTASILEPTWPLDTERSYPLDSKQGGGLSRESRHLHQFDFFFRSPAMKQLGQTRKKALQSQIQEEL